MLYLCTGFGDAHLTEKQHTALLAWILDCGASEHAASGRSDVVGKPTQSDVPTALITGNGVVPITQEVRVTMPGIKGSRSALLNRHWPNMASLGRFIYDDDYVLEKWDKESGLKLVDPEGTEVPNHVIN